ncbi:serine/threonine-protein kinase ATG1 [Cryptococcus amylolentus CBS 6273]|uniref:non-specific serine/threonine protein kinase n=1 Tax=Cryptococcus amylolentus CBS 6273 TaxID=1296118 RepID=A0A1E3KDZ9_9TREE|nr:serine/threonine-protein kinase ATG1 [Cryptococcus amylolentus CBS 6273]
MPDSNAQSGRDGHSQRKERLGNYVVGTEIGRGSFATVFKGYRSKTKTPIAIKAVSRQKLSGKLLDSLESEINILKVIHHRNIVALTDCFKNDTHIYLVMELCTGSDLSFYIRHRGKLPTLDFVPKPGSGMELLPRNEEGKVYWPHPESGGLDERATRCFLGQLAQALRALRDRDLIHRDIKPQNLLMQPATDEEVAEGHPYGIPVLKVADFGFARVLAETAMAETLCGSPLYMAPEILRHKQYNRSADMWSVGAVLYEMSVGRPPFRAQSHVELLQRIQKGRDRIVFPDEKPPAADGRSTPTPQPVSPDIKALIRALLKYEPKQRMDIDTFFECGVWDDHMTESTDESTTLEASSDSSGLDLSEKIRQMVASTISEERAHQPKSDPDCNPQPISTSAEATPLPVTARPAPVRRSTPKYYVGDSPSTEPLVRQPSPPSSTPRANPRPIMTTAQRRLSGREPASVEEAGPMTPPYTGPSPTVRPSRNVGEGSPLAAAPPITMRPDGKLERANPLDGSGVGTDYVVVEKQTVEINSLADELDQASKRPIIRRSSRGSVVSRPVSFFKPTSPITGRNESAVAPISHSPPYQMSSTPPFAMQAQGHSPTNASFPRNASISKNLNYFPPAALSGSPGYGQDAVARFGVSPQTGALARALTNTAIRLIGTGANSAATAIAKATAKHRPTIVRVSDIDAAEEELLRVIEDLARKAFVLFELADERLLAQTQLAQAARASTPTNTGLTGTTPPFSMQAAAQGPNRRKSSSGSFSNEVWLLRQQEAAANEAVVLYMKSLAFIVKAMERVKRYWKGRTESYEGYVASQELNEMGQWLRARFNDVYENAEWAKLHAGDNLLFPDWLIHDKARDTSRQAAVAELQGELVVAEQGYETSLWLLQVLLDESIYDGGDIPEDDRISYENLMIPVKTRLDALRKKLAESSANAR